MKKNSRLSALFLVIIMVLSFATTAFAAEPTGSNETSAVFDLSKREEQTFSYFNSNNEKITMGLRPVGAESRPSEPWSEGVWEIYLYGPLSCSYYIDISSAGKITNAYDESYLGILLDVKSDKLTYTSSSAKYYLTWTFAEPIPEIASSSGSLNAKISGENLVVSNNIY